MKSLRFVLAAIVVVGCSQAPRAVPISASDREAIAAASRAFSDAYVRNDGEALGRLYTEDAFVMPSNRTMRGREEARRYFQWAPTHRQVAHSMESQHLDVRGDTAIDVGMWKSTHQRGDEPVATSTGAYLVVWVKESDGAWRMKYDVWHRPVPTPTPTPVARP